MRVGNRWWRTIIVLAAALPAVALTGCDGASGDARPSATPPMKAGLACPDDAARGTAVWFDDGAGDSIAGVAVGQPGGTWVVLAHMAGGSVCQWLGYGRQLTAAGYRVLAIDLPGEGASGDSTVTIDAAVTRAVGYVRSERRAARVVLMGASMGGTAVLAAAPSITPAVAGVVALSAPASYRGVSTDGKVSRLAVPALYVAGAAEGGFSQTAQSFADTTPAGTPKRLLLVPADSDHGTELLRSAAVQDAIRDFLTTHAPA